MGFWIMCSVITITLHMCSVGGSVPLRAGRCAIGG